MPNLASYPLGWLEHATPRRGYVLVLREEVPAISSGLIHIPNSYRNKVKKSQATIYKSASPRFARGDEVLLGVAVSRRLEFGILGERVVLYVAHEREILCKFVEEAQVEDVGEAFFGRAPVSEDYYLVRGDRAEEGLAVAVGDGREAR